jgi:predicted hydrolase (HD superfamily)
MEGLTRDVAWTHLCEWTQSESLRRHARAVELAMRAAATKYGSGTPESIERWGITGMLHDADYDAWPEDHPNRIVSWLEERGEAEMAYAISAHYTKWGKEYRSDLDKALLACDELTGLIMACCLLRPDGIASLKPKSVKKKLKDKRFAAGVDRSEVSEGIRLLDAELGDHIQFLIDALSPHAEELRLKGTGAAV